MRNIVTISLPKQLDEQIEKEVESGNFASKSEFVRYLIRLWKEEKLVREIKQAEKEIKAGLVKKFKSMKDLE
jgi:putative addiction module CopG family antidote